MNNFMTKAWQLYNEMWVNIHSVVQNGRLAFINVSLVSLIDFYVTFVGCVLKFMRKLKTKSVNEILLNICSSRYLWLSWLS